MGICHEYYIRLDCAQKLFGKQYIQVSISQLTNNGEADPNGRMGGDEVVEVRFMNNYDQFHSDGKVWNQKLA